MRFGSYHECVEHAASALMRAAGEGKWDRAELRLMWLADDVTVSQSTRVRGKVEEDVPFTTNEWIADLTELLARGKDRFTKMSLDVTRDGRFDARYSYEPIPENAEELMAIGKLPPGFWP